MTTYNEDQQTTRSNKLLPLFITVLSMLWFTLSSCSTAEAHALSASYTTLTFDEHKTEMLFSLDSISVLESLDVDTNKNGILEQEELTNNEHLLDEWISDSVVLEMNDLQQTSEFNGIKIERKGDKEVVTWTYTYPAFSSGQTISVLDGLYTHSTASAYVNLLTSKFGDQVSEAVLQGKNRTWIMLLTEEQQQQASPVLDDSHQNPPKTPTSPNNLQSSVTSSDTGSAWFSFLKLGIHHILTGYDHMLFLFALLLRKQSFKQYALTITAFTIAHSITLTLAVLGWVSIPTRIVESIVALSICYVALENIFRKEIRKRWLVTFIFGLIHGIAFSEVLREMNLPMSHLVIDLISFNAGIEFIQLCIVIVLLPILILIQRKTFLRPAVNVGSIIITGLGAFWLVQRLFL